MKGPRSRIYLVTRVARSAGERMDTCIRRRGKMGKRKGWGFVEGSLGVESFSFFGFELVISVMFFFCFLCYCFSLLG